VAVVVVTVRVVDGVVVAVTVAVELAVVVVVAVTVVVPLLDVVVVVGLVVVEVVVVKFGGVAPKDVHVRYGLLVCAVLEPSPASMTARLWPLARAVCTRFTSWKYRSWVTVPWLVVTRLKGVPSCLRFATQLVTFVQVPWE